MDGDLAILGGFLIAHDATRICGVDPNSGPGISWSLFTHSTRSTFLLSAGGDERRALSAQRDTSNSVRSTWLWLVGGVYPNLVCTHPKRV